MTLKNSNVSFAKVLRLEAVCPVLFPALANLPIDWTNIFSSLDISPIPFNSFAASLVCSPKRLISFAVCPVFSPAFANRAIDETKRFTLFETSGIFPSCRIVSVIFLKPSVSNPLASTFSKRLREFIVFPIPEELILVFPSELTAYCNVPTSFETFRIVPTLDCRLLFTFRRVCESEFNDFSADFASAEICIFRLSTFPSATFPPPNYLR